MKKTATMLLLLLFSFVINAQQLRVNEVDDFTGNSKKFSKNYIIGVRGQRHLKASFKNINDSYAVSVYVTSKSFGCSGTDKSYIIFLFEDGTKLRLGKDVEDINCRDYATSTFRISSSELYMLSNRVVKKIRFSQSDGYWDFDTSGTYSVSQQISIIK